MTTAPSPMLGVQGAIWSLLSTDPELADMPAAVYDYVPEDVPYPFVVIGEAIETPDNRHGGFGRETVPTLHVWDQYRGYARVLRIGDRITELLDHQPLTIPGQDWIATRFEFSQTLTDPEPPGNIRHLVLRYRIVTEQH
ncbi:DUF3168 domain-containing protein [Streptomyces sp. TRM75563]|uniref:DUF3168 domain-containing protein n=1 Tax=Streptomyces sp. TRM75563 TaxID=2817418 RepID=UPI001F621415|nr:DUF3168 domain-containing protein [Streptomyces sp. TRM75563]MCI4045133.1 DUF3168 domain-containing protein [Streptomyces sp. TRM75563]